MLEGSIECKKYLQGTYENLREPLALNQSIVIHNANHSSFCIIHSSFLLMKRSETIFLLTNPAFYIIIFLYKTLEVIMPNNQVTNQAPPSQIPPPQQEPVPSSLSIASMVLGIVGVIGFFITCVPYIGWILIIPFFVVDVLAIVFGFVELNKIKKGLIPRVPNKTMSITGVICGVVPIILWIIMIVFLILGVGGTFLAIMLSEGNF